ncbi:outer membrane protein transport protein [Flammeovirga sp. OC4]|uniref:outer membrane protein transport protein n=1 Tax=Flammeovirga sp. OC4 TaxID=1382345 RepID=UPI0012E005E6|nr:outer membrane protein transport protein [Flammeovirga sp. OC4]
MLRIYFPLLLLCFITPIATIMAQGNFYWQQQQGANGNLLGGSLASGATDNSAIFYNPGALAFTETPNVSFTSDLLSYTFFNIENGAGQGVDIKGNQFETKPQMISGTAFNLKKRHFKVTYAIINLLNTKSEYTSSNQGQIPNSNDYYEGYFNYKNQLRNDRIAIGTTYRISESLGVGVTHFIDIKNAELTNNTNETWSRGTQITNYSNDYKNLRFNQVSILWKIGLAWHYNDRLNIGFNFETSDINVQFLSKSNSRRIIETMETSGEVLKEVSDQEKVDSKYKLPITAELNIGYITKKTEYSARIGFFGKVQKYGILSLKPENSMFSSNDDAFSQYFVANKTITNIAVGVKHELVEDVNVLMGFRTDFNFLDFGDIDPIKDNRMSFDYWDLYHLSAGFEWFGPRFNIIGGLVCDMGFSENDIQIANLTTRPYSEVFDRKSNTSTTYLQFNLIFGITYHFKDRTQL